MAKAKFRSQPKVNYAARLNAARKAESYERTRRLISLEYQFMTVMLNREFGFGRERLLRAQNALNAVHEEYADAVYGVDGEYANGALEREVNRIMRETNE